MRIQKNDCFSRWWHKRRLVSLITSIAASTVFTCVAFAAPAAPAHSAAPAPSPTPVPLKVGVLLSMSGQNESLAALARNGLELAREELKLASSQVVYLDLASNGEQANLNEKFKQLLNGEQVNAIIGDVAVDTSAPLALPASTYRIPYIMPVAPVSSLPADAQFAFSMYPRVDSVDKAYRKFFELKDGIKSIAIFCSSSEQGFSAVSMLKGLAAARGTIVTDEMCGNENAYNFQINIMRANSAKPDAMFFGFGIEMAKRWADGLGVKSKILGTQDVASALEIRGFPADAAEGIYYVDWNLNEEFSNAYQAKYSSPPVYIAYLAYESLRAIVKAKELSPYDIRAGLKQLKYEGASGEVNFQNDQAVNFSQAVLKQVKNGRGTVVP